MTKPLTIVIDYVLLLMDCAVSLQVILLMTEHFAFILGLEFINFLVLRSKLLDMLITFCIKCLLVLQLQSCFLLWQFFLQSFVLLLHFSVLALTKEISYS